LVVVTLGLAVKTSGQSPPACSVGVTSREERASKVMW
jgi:hypothetical protein